MAIGDHFIHQCTIDRPDETLDAYGNADPVYRQIASGVACRLVEKDERVWSTELQESMVVTKYLLLLGAGVDVSERDRVAVNDGVSTRTFTIAARLKRNARGPHHISARLEIVE